MKNEHYDPRRMNVLSLKTATDCRIAAAELERCASTIRRDLSRGLGDQDWEDAARIALGDYEHKLKLVQLKLVDFEATPRAGPTMSPGSQDFSLLVKAVALALAPAPNTKEEL